MKKTNLCLSGALGALVLSVAVLGGCLSAPEPEPLRLSVFMSHLKDISAQRGISVAAAAAAARSWGITGLDMIEGAANEETVRQVTAAGLEPVCYVIFADFTHSDDAERVDRKLDFAVRNGFKRIMLVPGMLKKGEDREALWPDVRRRLTAFVRKAGEKGLPVGCEDFDSADVSVGSQAHLRRALAEIPGLEHVLDTGNYTFWKDDVLSALAEFRPRIGHVHVKDLDRANPRKSVAAGTGLVPVAEVVRRLRATGYDGWFVVECFGSKNAWSDIRAATEYLKGLSAPGVEMPAKELVDFASVTLAAGEEKTVAFRPEPEWLRYWDERSGKWAQAPRGVLRIGEASDRLTVQMEL